MIFQGSAVTPWPLSGSRPNESGRYGCATLQAWKHVTPCLQGDSASSARPRSRISPPAQEVVSCFAHNTMGYSRASAVTTLSEHIHTTLTRSLCPTVSRHESLDIGNCGGDRLPHLCRQPSVPSRATLIMQSCLCDACAVHISSSVHVWTPVERIWWCGLRWTSRGCKWHLLTCTCPIKPCPSRRLPQGSGLQVLPRYRHKPISPSPLRPK
jgi:hypothetical protein